jgi:Zn-dependent peptidase ImmA (M78 family)|nr:MAG TPA: IrrE protein [Caudoviricetes sp.]
MGVVFVQKVTPKQLISKYKTNNPQEIAQELGIIILFEPLGEINGYYNTAFRQKFIHINNTLVESKQKFTIAHELGHALLHPKANTPFLRDNTLFSINKLEIEANKFVVDLLITDEAIDEVKHLTLDQMANYFGINKNLIKLRLKI